ncbi:hypothetical protein [Streptomyces sp. NPDC060027]|uniref:hypothetical protein n=1 Tax=Streptomyces sp. NPDC060027 TaxID=3347040 RepID=UPI0036A2843E
MKSRDARFDDEGGSPPRVVGLITPDRLADGYRHRSEDDEPGGAGSRSAGAPRGRISPLS